MTNVIISLKDFQLDPFKASIIVTPNTSIQAYSGSLIPNVPKRQWDTRAATRP